jgi:hypothetical protein
MCEENGRFIITQDRGDGYIRGRCGHKGWYVPKSANDRLRQAARNLDGHIASIETVRGMFVKVHWRQ